MEKRKIWRRDYDGKSEGYSDEKYKNEFLGEFEVERQIDIDAYSEEFIGIKDGVRYLVRGVEVSGMRDPNNGGIKYMITDISDEKK